MEEKTLRRNYKNLLEAKWSEGKFVCVGLDSELAKIPHCMQTESAYDTILNFNRAIVDSTKDIAGLYKLNMAFYQGVGDLGSMALEKTIKYINKVAPDVAVILDCKDGDIGNTNRGYITSAFERFGADAVTVPPYMGQESLQHFLDKKDKGIIVLCRTSNPGAPEFQNRLTEVNVEEYHLILEKGLGHILHTLKSDCEGLSPFLTPCHFVRLFELVAFRVSQFWNKNGNCGAVFGGTAPEELAIGRKVVGDLPLLIPGIGEQGGDVKKTVKAAKDSRGKGFNINSSRDLIFASGGEDFAHMTRHKTLNLHNKILKHLG